MFASIVRNSPRFPVRPLRILDVIPLRDINYFNLAKADTVSALSALCFSGTARPDPS
jgi:hypothetical protein